MRNNALFGASLDEVWGNGDGTNLPPKKTKSSSLRPNDDQDCSGILKNKILDPIYKKEHEAPYNKNESSRVQLPQDDTDGGLDRDNKLVVIPTQPKELPKERKLDYKEHFTNTSDREKQYLDLALYVFSGIVLIFVMEQFIQIGINLRSN